MAEARAEIEIVGDSRSVERAASRTERALGGLRATIGSVAKMAASFAGGFAVMEGVSRAFDFVRDAALGMNQTLEQARIGFTTMLGSAEKADRFLREMARFAAETPFEFPDLLEATRRMLAFGFSADRVLPTLRAVGDAAAAMGLGAEGVDRIITALGQMQAKAKVSAEEMLQLTEAGIPAWDILAKGIGVSTAELQKMVSKGLVPADRAIRILVQGMEQRFPNMMRAQSESWQGMVSTIIDNTRLLIAQAFAPWFSALKDRLLRPLRDALDEARAAAEQSGLRGALLALVPEGIVQRLEAVRQALQPLIDLIGELTGWWRASTDEGQRAAAYLEQVRQRLLATGMSVQDVNRYIQLHRDELLASIPPTVESARTYGELRKALEGVGISGRDAAKAMQVLGPEILAANQPKGPNLAQQLADAIRQQDWAAVGRALGEGIIAGIRAAKDLGTAFGNAIVQIVTQVNWRELAQRVAPAIFDFTIGLVGALTDPAVWLPALARNWDVILPLAIGVMFAPAKWLGWIGQALRKIPLVGRLLGWLWEGVTGLLQRVGEPFKRAFGALGGRFVEGLRSGWGARSVTLFPTVRQHLTNLVNGLRDLRASWWQRGLEFAERLGAGLGDRLGSLRGAVVRLINRAIDSPLGSAIGRAWSFGRRIVDGLWGGIASLARTMAQRVSRWVSENVVAPIKRLLRIGSPSRLTMDYGRWLVEGLALGLDRNLHVAVLASTRLAAATAAPVRLQGPGGSVQRERIIERHILHDAVIVMDGRMVGRLAAPHVNVQLAGRQGLDLRAQGRGVVVTA